MKVSKSIKTLAAALAAVAVMAGGARALTPPPPTVNVAGQWPCGADGANVTATLDVNGTLTVSGSGAMKNFGWSGCLNAECGTPWGSLKKVIIEEGVTYIGTYAFAGSFLESVTCSAEIPPSVGISAFEGSYFLTLSLFVPVSAISTYRDTHPWENFCYINPSTVRFRVVAGGDFIDSQKVSYGDKVIRPAADPTRDGYIFDGWYGALNPDGIDTMQVAQLWDFETPVMFPPLSSYDFVLFAKWTADPASIAAKRVIHTAKRFGIAQNGANLRIVGTSQATNIRIYNLNGKLLLSRSAMPNEVISVSHLARGTYVVKALGNSVRIVR